MPEFDLSTRPRIQQLVELYQATSRITDPLELQREYAYRIRALFRTKGYLSLSTRGLRPGEYRITRIWFDGEALNDWQDNWKRGHALAIHTGGWLGRVVRTPAPKLYTHLDLSDDPVIGSTLAGVGSAIASPLFDGGEALNWGIVFLAEPDGFTAEDIENFFSRGNMIGGMVKGLVLKRQVDDLNHQLTAQLEQIAQIQRSLLPDRAPTVDGITIATSYLTSNEAGGDYYDFFPMRDGRLGVLIADVAGHGAGAATVMAMLQTILHDYQDQATGPASMLAHANRQLLNKRIENNFVTAFMGVVDRDRGVLTYANAGHNHPVRRLPSGLVVPITGAGSLPLGVLEEAEYEQANTSVESGETVVMYTDGITEAFSPPPVREMFGESRLVGAVRDCSGEPPCIIESIHERLYEHTSSRSRADDQTIVALKIEE